MCKKNPHNIQELQKQAYNKNINPKNNISNDKV